MTTATPKLVRSVSGPLVLVLAACASTDSPSPDRQAAQAQFAQLRALEGDWITPLGFDAQKFVTTFHVTCNGSVVVETLFKGTPREEISMYYLDGERLMQTHYSILESQTRMVAASSSQPGEIAFEFHDATTEAARGLLPLGHDHVSAMRLRIKDPDHIEEWWQLQLGDEVQEGTIELTRTSGGKSKAQRPAGD